ncbi:MAG: NAD(+) kinase [Bdellovibrionales bacterium CG10_big_fil_rev_8_21_14_0_10_45_34]|nr:MAG: NAD(+) kinase [Bdellovibrionales bacterium CG10_big_fil_rev_8_21_14_0_10_45_34]
MSKKQIRAVALAFKPQKPEAKLMAQRVISLCRSQKITVYSAPEQPRLQGIEDWIEKSKARKVDLVIALGGDGTYLRAARYLNGTEVPVLGIHMGFLGFLTPARHEDLERLLNLAFQGKLPVLKRALLEVQFQSKSSSIKCLALNDVVLERGGNGRLMNLSIHSGKDFVTRLKADGLIVSTPTGSTAYNLAASGPIIHPGVAALVVTPICPHSLTTRPLVLCDEHSLMLEVESPTQTSSLVIDGYEAGHFSAGDRIVIRRSKKSHHMLVPPTYSYFETLREKLRFGERD